MAHSLLRVLLVSVFLLVVVALPSGGDSPKTKERIPKKIFPGNAAKSGAPPQPDAGQKKKSFEQTADGTERWGYVDLRAGAHMFWWLYYTTHQNGFQNRPLVLWLQGGPGGSSCGYGNFELIGPLDLDLNPRNTTWVQAANVLFVDNPVGTGYSYVDYDSAYTTTNEEIADDLVTFMKAFMQIVPEMQTIPLYVFGQSYGGKMASSFVRKLHAAIQNSELQCDLRGYAMGNSWISPIDSLWNWGPLLYWMSTIDEIGLQDYQVIANNCVALVNAGRWHDAVNCYGSAQGVINFHSNYVDFYNILKFRVFTKEQKAKMTIEDVILDNTIGVLQQRDLDDLMNGPIREKLGIIPNNVTWGGQSNDVFTFQRGDFMKPVVDVVDDILNNTNLHVVVYSGQLDLICETKGTMDWIQQLTWANLGDYYDASRDPLTDPENGQTELFVKAFRQFKFYSLLRGGHSVAKDQGKTALRMLNRILDDVDN